MPLVQPSLSTTRAVRARPLARSGRFVSAMPRVLRAFAVICVGGLSASVASALAAFPGDNGKIVFHSDRGLGDDLDIWTMNPDGSNRVNLTDRSRGEDAFPNWSADGQKILFMSDRETPGNPVPPGAPEPDFEIFVMNADGSNQRQITFNELDDEDPAWSPSGKRIVFWRNLKPPARGEFDMDILTMKADGSAERNLTKTPGVAELQPSWSPNGSKIAFARAPDLDSASDIYTMSPDGTNEQQLTRGGLDNEFPNWSPDGTRIVFNGLRDEPLGENYEVYSMSAGGGRVTRLTFEPAAGDYVPAWSPDGRRIVFASSRAGSAIDIFTMRPDGSNQRNRTNDADDRFNGAPDWQPLVDAMRTTTWF
jgi:Tol biopolymer transport system component